MTTKIVLVTGATGKQGGAVARELLRHGGFQIRALTRKPDGVAAQELAKLGATIVQGDLENEASLRAALDGVWGVFSVSTMMEGGVETEEEQGKRVAKLAREANVQHFVYTSVGSAHKNTGIPHFESKWRIEQTVRELAFPSHVILRPVFFMENFLSPWMFSGNRLQIAIQPTTKLQMVCVEDIGKLGALAFTKASDLRGAEIDFGGDSLTGPEMASTLSKVLGKPVEFASLPQDMLRKQSEDLFLMMRWFDQVGYSADIEGVQKKYGLSFLRLADFAAKYMKS